MYLNIDTVPELFCYISGMDDVGKESWFLISRRTGIDCGLRLTLTRDKVTNSNTTVTVPLLSLWV